MAKEGERMSELKEIRKMIPSISGRAIPVKTRAQYRSAITILLKLVDQGQEIVEILTETWQTNSGKCAGCGEWLSIECDKECILNEWLKKVK